MINLFLNRLIDKSRSSEQPVSPLYLIHFSSLLSFPFFPQKVGCRVWSWIRFFTHWSFKFGIKLIMKVMACFRRMLHKLHRAFCGPSVYEEFRDQILSYRKEGGELHYNHYSVESYKKIKNSSLGILDRCKNEEQKELKAGIATYEAIVNLYVQRFLDNSEMKDKLSLPLLYTTALITAIKDSYDTLFNKRDFELFLPENLMIDLYSLEITFLKGMQWNISTTELLPKIIQNQDPGDKDQPKPI
jgi:hypothetical protein